MEGQSIMTDDPVELDEHRGMAAQKSTEIRRRLHQVQADQAALRRRQEEFERHALAAPQKTKNDYLTGKAPYKFESAMLRMAEAGAAVPQIASVSGHSIEATQRILEAYLPRNRDLPEIATTRLAEYKKRPKVQRESNS
jgi:hypothetical protein